MHMRALEHVQSPAPASHRVRLPGLPAQPLGEAPRQALLPEVHVTGRWRGREEGPSSGLSDSLPSRGAGCPPGTRGLEGRNRDRCWVTLRLGEPGPAPSPGLAPLVHPAWTMALTLGTPWPVARSHRKSTRVPPLASGHPQFPPSLYPLGGREGLGAETGRDTLGHPRRARVQQRRWLEVALGR